MLQALGIIIGMLSGVSGLVLGILNYIHSRDTTRPKLRIRAAVKIVVDLDPEIGGDMSKPAACIFEVSNIGRIPVLATGVGFEAGHGGEGGWVKSPTPFDGGRWPREIEPGHVVNLHVILDADTIPMVLDGRFAEVFVRSAIGDVFKASAEDTKRFRDEVQRNEEKLLRISRAAAGTSSASPASTMRR